jgi:gamma-glutamyltranspeptidase
VTRAWRMLLERFGTRPLGSLLAPAIHYAADGYPISDVVCQSIRERAPLLEDPEWRRAFVPGGAFPKRGDRFRQPDLARTLTELADDPELFYRGRVARAIVARLEAEGFLTEADLAEHTGEWEEPISTTYRGYTVYQTPPPTQGLAVLLALNLLEGVELAALPVHSVEHLHALLEMTKLAYADRDRWIGDPAQARVPVEALIAKEYAVRRRRAFDPDKAQAYVASDLEGDTTGFVIADGRGDVISVIQSLYRAFGSGVIPPGTGVVLHNRGAYFKTEREHPSSFAPRKRPFHTLVTCLVTRAGAPVLGYSTMGGDGQAAFHVQGLTNVLDHGMEIQEAIERPRFANGRLVAGDAPDLVRLEGRISADVRETLAARGHNIAVVSDWFSQMGHAHGITLREGTLAGGADPRGDGAALGF